MAVLCAEVNLGINKPLLVLLMCSMALLDGVVVPMPTLCAMLLLPVISIANKHTAQMESYFMIYQLILKFVYREV